MLKAGGRPPFAVDSLTSPLPRVRSPVAEYSTDVKSTLPTTWRAPTARRDRPMGNKSALSKTVSRSSTMYGILTSAARTRSYEALTRSVSSADSVPTCLAPRRQVTTLAHAKQKKGNPARTRVGDRIKFKRTASGCYQCKNALDITGTGKLLQYCILWLQ